MLRKKLYVAYGSNLNKTQMKYRCPNAEFVGTGTLRGYELQFKGARNYAYATIAPKPDSEVPVGVWKITPEDISNRIFPYRWRTAKPSELWSTLWT